MNDRVLFNFSSAPSFTNASLPPSGDAGFKCKLNFIMYSLNLLIQHLRLQKQKVQLQSLSFDGAGTGVEFKKIHLADVVKDAPIPVGGTLKVISGQKLVLESDARTFCK